MSNLLRTSEYVTIGHPDKMADYISEYILDRILEKDPNVRYALECQIKDDHVNVAGEVTTSYAGFTSFVPEWVREAVNRIGYTKEYQRRFGKNCTICGDELAVGQLIAEQSTDISVGVNRKGWGDQGIFFGMWSDETEEGYTKEYQLAKLIGNQLFIQASTGLYPIGLDIKTQVTYDVIDKEVKKVIVAIPTPQMEEKDQNRWEKTIVYWIKHWFPETKKAKFIVNGTGAYHVHGPVGDSGTTGRKLVVDFYGAGCRIGGGSPWTKDGTKADLTLNIFARELAKLAFFHWKDEMPSISKVETELSCCIGKQEIICVTTAYDIEGFPIHRMADERKVSTDFLIERYHLKEPNFAARCANGLFSIEESQ